MASDKYAALDAAILSAISAEPKAFNMLLVGSVGDEARKHETTGREAFRVLDARLQAMRRARRIKSVRGKLGPMWVIAEGGAA